MKLIKNVKHFVSRHKLPLFLSLFLSIMLGIYIRQFFTIPRLSQDQQVRESPRICVHTLAIHGSHEGVQLVSYPCDKVMDWERLQSPSIEAVRRGVRWDTIFKEEGVYDSWTTPECPHLYFEKSRIDSYGLIIMKQGKICKMFAHDYPEPILEHIIVDVKGKFQVVFEVDSNNVQLVPKIEYRY